MEYDVTVDTVLLKFGVEHDLEGAVIVHTTYSIFSLLRDFGGALYCLLLLFGFLMSPCSKYSFNMWAGRRLYFGSSTKRVDIIDK